MCGVESGISRRCGVHWNTVKLETGLGENTAYDIVPRPSQYAIWCVEDFKFVELWYFTPEGCAEALHHQHTQNNNAFGLSKIDGMVTLKSVSSLKASKNVVPDTELSFQQMSMAKNVLIPLLSKYKWTEKAIWVFAQFWTQLKIHPFWQWEYRERTLLVYQVHIHWEWHDQMKLGKGFNISVMNEDLLQSIYREILDKAQLNSINEVSWIFGFPSHLI